MPLKLPSLGEAVEQMTELALARRRSEGLSRARQLLDDAVPHQLRAKLPDRAARVPRPVAGPLRTLDTLFPPS